MVILENVDLHFTPSFEVTEAEKGAAKLRIGGIALVEGVSKNKKKYTFENLQENDGKEFKWLVGHHKGKPIEEHIVGKGKLNLSGKELLHDGTIINTAKHPDVIRMVQEGLYGPSIHAIAKKIELQGDEYVCEGLDIRGVSLVAFQGVKSASISYAIAESFNDVEEVKESEDEKDKPTEENKMAEPKVEAPAEAPKEAPKAEEPKEEVKESVSLEEFNALKAQFEELKVAKKKQVAESISKLNSELKVEELMNESEEKLNLVLEYEQKLSSKTESAAVVETADSEKELFVQEASGDWSMTKEAYEDFNKEIRERL